MISVKIYTADNILGRAIQSYFYSIFDHVFTSDSINLSETEPEFSTDMIFINLISSQLSPLKTIKQINTKTLGDDDMTFIIIVDSRDIIICRNILINKKNVVLDLNTPLSYYADIIKKHTSLYEGIKQNNKLTRKERAILLLLLEGLSVANISIRLQCNSKTIYTHRTNIIKKLKFTNAMELNKSIARLSPPDNKFN